MAINQGKFVEKFDVFANLHLEIKHVHVPLPTIPDDAVDRNEVIILCQDEDYLVFSVQAALIFIIGDSFS